MQFRPHLIAAAALIAASAAHADSFNFSGVIDAGPLSGQSFSGSYTVNTALVTGADFEQIALTAFSLTFNATTYTLNSSATADYSGGVFLGLGYTGITAGGTLSMVSGSMDVTDAFLSYAPTSGIESSGMYSVTAVPEPETWALMLGGLGAIGMLARRRRAD